MFYQHSIAFIYRFGAALSNCLLNLLHLTLNERINTAISTTTTTIKYTRSKSIIIYCSSRCDAKRLERSSIYLCVRAEKIKELRLWQSQAPKRASWAWALFA